MRRSYHRTTPRDLAGRSYLSLENGRGLKPTAEGIWTHRFQESVRNSEPCNIVSRAAPVIHHPSTIKMPTFSLASDFYQPVEFAFQRNPVCLPSNVSRVAHRSHPPFQYSRAFRGTCRNKVLCCDPSDSWKVVLVRIRWKHLPLLPPAVTGRTFLLRTS